MCILPDEPTKAKVKINMLNRNKKIISVQSITDTFGGNLCILAMVVFQDNLEIDRLFVGIDPVSIEDSWVHKKIIPILGEEYILVSSYKELLNTIAVFYNKHKVNSVVTQHYAVPRKVVFWRDMVKFGFLDQDDEYDSPYPIYETSGMLAMIGECPHSINRYNKKNNILGNEYQKYKTFHPIYDAVANGLAFMDLIKDNKGEYVIIEIDRLLDLDKIIKELKLQNHTIVDDIVKNNPEKNLRKISTTYINDCYISGQKFLLINSHKNKYKEIKESIGKSKIAIPDKVFIVGLNDSKSQKIVEIYKNKSIIKLI